MADLQKKPRSKAKRPIKKVDPPNRGAIPDAAQRRRPAAPSMAMQAPPQAPAPQGLLSNLGTARDAYKRLLAEKGGDIGEAYNETEAGRVGSTQSPTLTSLSPELRAAVNRIAMTKDSPIAAPLLPIYEGLKGIEQKTGLPTYSAFSKMGLARATPTTPGVTTQASMLNALSGLLGPAL